MRLFDFKRAPNPRRVRIFLAEKNVDIPKVPVNLFRMEQLSAEFLAINPGGTVPVLETDDGTYIAESILRNLSPGFRHRVFPGPADIEQMPALVERGRQRAQQFFDRIETQLSAGQFLAGDAFSVADITLLTIIDFATWVDFDAAAERPALAAWHQNMSARPSAGA